MSLKNCKRNFSLYGLLACNAIACVQTLSSRSTQEIIKVREVIPRIGPIPIVILLRLFLDDNNFPADNVTARATWKFHGGEKVQQILYDVIFRFPKLSFMA